jgi:hypothetical protein
MSNKHFRSKIGMVLAGAYILLIVVSIVAAVATPDGLSVIALMILAMPWSFIIFAVLEYFPPPGVVVALALYPFCVFLNAAILYTAGLGLSAFWKWLSAPSEGVSKPSWF